MKRTNLLIASLAMMASISAIGAAPAQSIVVLNKATAPHRGDIGSPADRERLEGIRSRTAHGKSWPFNGKNRAQRQRLCAGFCAMA